MIPGTNPDAVPLSNAPEAVMQADTEERYNHAADDLLPPIATRCT